MENSFEELFLSVPAHRLRSSVSELFISWIMEAELLPVGYKEITTDIYLLLDFLQKEELKEAILKERSFIHK